MTCPACRDNHGFIEVLPATGTRHDTLIRCPHDPNRIADKRAQAEADLDEPPRHRPRRTEPAWADPDDEEIPF